MSPIVWIVLVAVVIIVVAAVAWSAGQRRRSSRLRERFGPEYDRVVETAGGRSDAESELEARQERVDSLDIRSLDPVERDRFRERWRVVQGLFVDDPQSAVGEADTFIGDVMRARGYPVGDFEQRAADISVNHPAVVDHYRTAHAIAVRHSTGAADTEQLRQAMVHYRALASDLLDLPAEEVTGASGAAAANATSATAPGAPGPAEPAASKPSQQSPTGVPRRT